MSDYLRKELKVPLYSAMYHEELLSEQTKAIFEDNKTLEQKLN
jgi:hypothetical protein